MKQTTTIFLLLFMALCFGQKKVVTANFVKQIESVKKENTPKKTDIRFHQNLSKGTLNTHQLWDELLAKHVSENGNVDYKSFKTEHKKLLDYIYVLSMLYSNYAFKTLPKEEKLAFWINAYNAMTVDLILRNYPIKSIKDIKNSWEQHLWKSVNISYNLNEIEHQILRKMSEPRIHFAIVCASVSCPKLLNEAYTAANLEEQLTKATKDFLNDSTKNNISKDNIKLSKIFQWFAKDFKQNGSLIDFLNQYSNVQISAKAKKSFKTYNWDLNE